MEVNHTKSNDMHKKARPVKISVESFLEGLNLRMRANIMACILPKAQGQTPTPGQRTYMESPLSIMVKIRFIVSTLL